MKMKKYLKSLEVGDDVFLRYGEKAMFIDRRPDGEVVIYDRTGMSIEIRFSNGRYFENKESETDIVLPPGAKGEPRKKSKHQSRRLSDR
jgi:hypothetical protein